MSQPTGRPFTVVALIAAYNEDDVIDAVIGDLVRQRVGVYFIDNHSTDSTLARARPWLGRGVIGVETFPAERRAGDDERYPWADLLRRKEELAASLDADWFIHQDADEFRDSPWPGVDLHDAIELVDRQGYNAIDFEVFQFQPTDDRFQPGTDVRESLLYCEPPAEFDKLRINCWKRAPGVRFDLASQGGHDVSFAGRRVFPIRFLLRHYPIRSQSHGERKIHVEREPRFLAEEKARGWHRQYQESGHQHLRSPADLTRFDIEAARLQVQVANRRVDELTDALAATRDSVPAEELRLMTGARDAFAQEVEHRGAAIAELQARLRELERDLAASAEDLQRMTASRDARIEALEGSLQQLTASRDTHAREAERRGFALAAERARLAEVLASRSWRWTAPVRRVLTALSGPGDSPPAPSRRDATPRVAPAHPSSGADGATAPLSFVLPLALAGTGRPGSDLERASLMFESFERCFRADQIASFLVVTRPQDLDAVAAHLRSIGVLDSVDLISETIICPELAMDPPSLSEFPTPNHGWYRQQLVKLGAARRLASEFYMTLDADVIFTMPFTAPTLIRQQRAVVNTQTREDFFHRLTDYAAESSCEIRLGRDQRARDILGLTRTRDCFYGETPVIYNTALVRGLLDHLEASSHTSWASHLLAQIPWTEFALYYTFAEATGAYATHHVDGGCDAVMRISDSLWCPPDDYRVPRALDNWIWSPAPAEDGVAVVVQSYLGYKIEDIRARVRQLSRAG
jgi:hypothetical protein